MITTDISFILISLVIFTLINLGITHLLAGKKLQLWRYATAALATLAALVVSWLAAQLFISLSVVAGAVIQLLAYRFAVGFSWKKSLIGTGTWIVLWYLLNFIVVMMISM